VRATILDIASRGPDLGDDIFMKVGDSITVTPSYLGVPDVHLARRGHGSLPRSCLTANAFLYTSSSSTASSRGVVRILMAIPPRTNDTFLARWVPTVNDVVRGVAQTRQLPRSGTYLLVVTTCAAHDPACDPRLDAP